MSLRKTIVLVLLCFLMDSVYAQCTLTQGATSSSAAGSASSSLTFSISTSGSNRLLVVRASTYSSDPTSVTYAGVNLTKHATQHNNNSYVSIWYLVAPATGSNNVVVSGAAGFTPIVAANAFTGASQGAPLGSPVSTNFTNANPSLTVSSASGQIIIDVLNSNTALTLGAGTQTNSYSASSVGWYGSGSSAPGASSVTMSWSGLSPVGAHLAVAVKSCASVTADAGPDKVVCTGSGVSIGGAPTASGGTSPYTYSWSPSTNLSSTTAANPTASPTSNITYTVTVTDNTGATATDAVLVTVAAKPTVSAGSNKSICTGGSTAIGGSPTATGGTAPYTYAWTPATGLSPTNTANPTASPTSNTTYTVTVTDNNSCSNTSSVTVTVNAKPTANAGADKTICLDSTVTIGGSPVATGGTSPYTYSWSPTAGLSSATIANPPATPTATTNYTVTVTDNKGCSNTDAVLVTVNQNLVTLTANPGTTVCLEPGQVLKFTASPSYFEKYDFYRNGTLMQSGTSNKYNLTGGVTGDEIYVKVLNTSPDTVFNPCISSLQQGSTVSGSANSSATSLTLSYTVASGSNRLLVVRTSTISSDPTSVTYNGSAMTKYAAANNGGVRVSIWYQLNPATGAHNVVVNGTAGFTPIAGIMAYNGADQTTPFGTSVSASFTSSTTPSVSVTSATGQQVIDVINSQVSYSVGSGQTQQYNKNQSPYYGAGSSEAGAGTVTMSWTGSASTGVILAVPVRPFACVPDMVITNPACSKGQSASLTLSISPKPVIVITPSSYTVCKDESVSLAANGATVYSWSPSAGLTSTSTANVIATPITTTTYTVIGTGLGACKDTATAVVTVNPSCPGTCNSITGAWTGTGTQHDSAKTTSAGVQATVYLTSTGSAGRQLGTQTFANSSFWSQNLANQNSLFMGLIWDTTPDADGTKNIDGNDDKGNGTIKIVFAKEVLDPILHIDRIGGATPTGGTNYISNSALLTLVTPGLQLVRLAGTDDFEVTTYTIRRSPLENTDGNIEATQSKTTGTAAGSVKLLGLVKQALFTWTGTGVEGLGRDDIEIILEYCKDSISPCATIVADAGADKTICPGSTVTIGGPAQTGYSYSWAPASGLSCTNCANPQANPLTTTNYTLSVTYASCTVKTDAVLVTVNSTADANAGPDKSICSGSSVKIGVDSIAGYTYSWAPATGLSCTTCAKPSANPSSTINYTLTVSSPYCTASGKDEVQVSVGNTPVANAGANKYICAGTTVELGTTAQSNYTYSWTPTTGLSCSTCANPKAKPTTTTSYTLVVTDAHCAATATDVVVVKISNTPFADAGPDQTICPGASIQIGTLPQPDYVYSWTPTTGLSCSNCANPVVTDSVTTNYKLTVTAPNCSATSTDEVLVRVSDKPVADAGSDQTICPGSSVKIGGTERPDYTYTWTPATNLSCTDCANPLSTPAVSTTYTLTVSAVNCAGTATDVISVTISDIPVADAGTDKFICPGTSAAIGNLPKPGYTYSWSPAPYLSCTNCANPEANPPASSSYTLMVSALNCTGIGTDEVIVNVNNSPVSDAGPNQYICPGDYVQLGAKAQPGYNYLWQPSTGLSCDHCADPLANPSITTNYKLMVSSVDCSTNSTDLVTVHVSTGPTAIAGPDVIICSGQKMKIGTPVPQAGYTYSWSPATGLSCTDCANPTTSASSTTTYTLTVTSATCTGTSTDMVTVSVSDFNPVVSGTQTLCYGNDVHLGASGGIYYNWVPATGLSCTACPDPVASPSSTITYTVTITDVNGCATPKTVTVAVAPALIVSAGPDKSGCIGTTVTLTASGADSYLWTPVEGLSCTTCPNPSIVISKNKTYVVRGFSGICNATDTVEVKLPVENGIDFTYTYTGCNVTLNASISGLNSYTWNFGDGTTASTSSVTHQFTKNGIYEVCLTVKDTCNRDVKVCKYIEIKGCNCETN